jgi:hypothetical protein
MRIATFIIGLLVSLLMLAQGYIIAAITPSGLPLGAAILAFVGTAFVLRLPNIAFTMYLIAALLTMEVAQTATGSTQVWFFVLLILMGMAGLSGKELSKERAAQQGNNPAP